MSMAFFVWRNQPMKPTLILDADDTLWESEVYYQQAVTAFADLMAAQGFDRQEAQRTADAVEHERVPQVGYGPVQFACSLVMAYERLCERSGRPVDPRVSQAVREIGQRVLEPPIVLLEGVAEALAQLGRRCRLLLLTKGDRQVQQSKLARSGLEQFFEGVYIVPEKDAQALKRLIAEHRLDPAQVWMVGNSPRSDINPALQAGIGAIYIPHSRTWAFEQQAVADQARVITLSSFWELVRLFSDTEPSPC
jgi:putative hydrolase of the HAD superfamily